MNLQHPLQMIYSSHHGWDQLGQRHPSVAHSFVKIVLPASLFAAGMVQYCGVVRLIAQTENRWDYLG